MQSYTLILRNAHGRLVGKFEFGSADDAEAERIAQEESKGRPAELWAGDRRIGAWPASRERKSDGLIAEVLRRPLPAPADCAVIATSQIGLVSYWNRSAAALYGWSSREAQGRNIVDLTPAIQSRQEASEIMRSLRQGRSWQGEIVLRRKDGSLFRAFVLDIPVEASPGRPAAIVGISLPVERGDEIRLTRPAIEDDLRQRFASADPPAQEKRGGPKSAPGHDAY